MKPLTSTIIVFCALFLLSSCSVVTGSRDLASAESFVKKKQYNDGIAAYREMLRKAPDSLYAADARYSLAMALLAVDNPQKDYAQALQECEEFVKHHPNDRRVPSVQNMIGVLKTVTNLSRSIAELKKLDVMQEERRRK